MKIAILFCLAAILASFLLMPCEDHSIEDEVKISLSATFDAGVATASEPKKAPCECGVFKYSKMEEKSSVIVNRALHNVTCDIRGERRCRRKCSKLADVGKNFASQLICAFFGNNDPILVSMQTRTCDLSKWSYNRIFCCHYQKIVDCEDVNIKYLLK